MGKDDSLTLAHPSVQAAKMMWETGRFKKYGLTFEDSFDLIRGGCCLSERARQIYDTHFCKLFGEQSGRSLQIKRTLETRLAKVRQSEIELLDDPAIRAITEKALKAGCAVEILPHLKHGIILPAGSVKSTFLLINGHLCSVHHPTAPFKPNPKMKRSYTRIVLCHEVVCGSDAFVIHTTVRGFPEHTFVIPSSVLREKYFTPLRSKHRGLALQTEKLPVYNNRPPRLNIWKYKDAWHLLPPKP